MADLGNILANDDQLNEDQLRRYLAGNADASDIHAVEKQMADDDFMNDAVEGLQDFSSNARLEDYVSQLNKKLHQQLEVPKERKKKRAIKNLTWVVVAAIIILLLCIIGAWIIRIQRERESQKKNIITTAFVMQHKSIHG
ncbi:hypothetical protein I5907_01175 [Panacibacter sp. DH6]|uniref:Uncharacterized protein n=1 Tax=Panacibacter microcysteis TaxID=2793269 RepID=A0A931GTY7_9BACT|nr:hypothetical protein [Panacibacter microcysteis]MBG9374830.1 hypothetical protein [Panacibacter microcysteis]